MRYTVTRDGSTKSFIASSDQEAIAKFEGFEPYLSDHCALIKSAGGEEGLANRYTITSNHDPVEGVEQARLYIEDCVSPNIKASMMSYAIKLIATGAATPQNLDEVSRLEAISDLQKLSALELWEDSVLLAGKSGTSLPKPPEWYLSFIMDF